MDEHVPCDLCGSDRSTIVGVRDRRGHPLQTVACSCCGLVYSNPRPSVRVLREYYSTSYRLDYKSTSTPTRRRLIRGAEVARARIAFLRKYLKPGVSVLDVGCGAGEVLHLLRALGYDAAGIEPDEKHARYARETLGLSVSTGFVQDCDLPTATLDVITLYHTLEHTDAPSTIVAHVARWLRPGGVLVFEVPNVESACDDPAQQFHAAHLYSFSPKTLEAVGRKAGLAVRELQVTPDRCNMTAVFERGAAPSSTDWLVHLAGHGEAVSAWLSSRSRMGYYLSTRPYRLVWARAHQRMRELRTLAALRHAEGRALLDQLYVDVGRPARR